MREPLPDDERPALRVPPTAARTASLSRQVRRAAVWAGTIAVKRRARLVTTQLSARLAQRHDADEPSQMAFSTELNERFALEQRDVAGDVELTLSPFAPPLRQISSARQGSLEWAAPDEQDEPEPAFTRPQLDHAVGWLPRPPVDPLLGDLMQSGWGGQQKTDEAE